MEALFSRFDAIILSKKITTYDIPGDRHTIRTQLHLNDGSRLVSYDSLFYDTGRIKYSYQWMDANNQLIHRWDNAHEVPGIPTSPHHQHIGSEDNVHPCEPMTLDKVLSFIALQLTE